MKAQHDLAKDSGDSGPGRDVIETRCSSMWLGEDGILRSVAKPGVEMGLIDAKDELAAGVKIAGGRKVPLLVVAGGVRSIEREARTYFAGEAASNLILAQAILVRSPVGRVIGNFFLGFNKPRFPTRLFTSEAEALEWLRGFIK